MSAVEVVESGKRSAPNGAMNAASDKDTEQAAPTDTAIGEQDSNDAKQQGQQGDQLETSRTICGCACLVDCNCRCTCACVHHCVCRIRPCERKCGDRFSRNLVISIDGTSNQFGIHNTNVVELHSRIDTKANQSKYYNCGIGTYVPAQAIFKSMGQWVDHVIDLAFARNFKDIILQAYKWLSQMYQPGDKIFIFGFSRGAYQARALAGMIEKVGLVDIGNEAMIPFGYEIYLERHRGKVVEDKKKKREESANAKPPPKKSNQVDSNRPAVEEKKKVQDFKKEGTDVGSPATERGHTNQEGHKGNGVENGMTPDANLKGAAADQSYQKGGEKKAMNKADQMASNFKRTFSSTREGVRIHFAGLWDTVSSKGVVGGKLLPLTSSHHICIFRHALALDERRVKFLPEYVAGGGSAQQSTSQSASPDVQEVWFPGTHSDIGGGIKENENLNLSSVPLLWMENEATLAGLRLSTRKAVGEWNTGDLIKNDIHESLTCAWWPLEYLPLTRISFKSSLKPTTRIPHLGAGRIIAPGQRIHISVAFKENYVPRARFRQPNGIDWKSFTGKDIKTSTFEWVDQFGDTVEKGLFDGPFMIQAVDALQEIWKEKQKHSRDVLEAQTEARLIQRLAFMALSGQLAATYVLKLEQNSTTNDTREIADAKHAVDVTKVNNAVSVFETLRETQQGTFDADLAGLLEHKAGLLIAGKQVEDALRVSKEAKNIRLDIARRSDRAEKRAIRILETCLETYSGVNNEEVRKWDANVLRVIRSAVEFHSSMTRGDPNRPLASSLHCVGIVSRYLGHHQEAIGAHEEAIQLLRKLLATDPTVAKYLGDSLHHLGANFSILEIYKEALNAKEEAIEIRRQLVEVDPRVNKDLARSLYALGIDFRQLNRHADAARVDKEAAGIRRQLAQADPVVNKDLARSLYVLGIDFRQLNRHADAARVDEEAAGIRRQLAEADPTVSKDLASSLHNLGIDFTLLDRHADAARVDEEAAGIRRQLAEADPTVNNDLASSLHNLGIDFTRLNRHTDAACVDEQAGGIRRQLAEADPTGMVNKDLARSLYALGIDFRQLNRHAEAARVDEEAAGIRRQLAEVDPVVKKDLARSLYVLGIDFRQLNRHIDAAGADEEAAGIRRQLAEADPTVNKDLASSLHNLGVDFTLLHRHADAARVDQEAAGIRRQLAEADPTVKKDLASSLYALGVDFRQLNRHADAARVDEEAVGIRRQLAEADSTVNKDLASSLYNLGIDFKQLHRHADAARVHEEAAGIRRQLALGDPAVKNDLARSLYALGIDFRQLNRYADAARVDEEAAGIRRQLAEADPTANKDLASSLHNLGVDLTRLNRHADAAHVDEEAAGIRRQLAKADPTVKKDLATSLYALGVDFRQLNRHEDAARVDEEAAGIRLQLAQADPMGKDKDK